MAIRASTLPTIEIALAASNAVKGAFFNWITLSG
jgi:hypothetical protein